MPTISSLGVTTYDIGAPQVIANVLPLRGEHYIYTTNEARIDALWAPDLHDQTVQRFTGKVNLTGTALYLPYEDDKITSLRLPIPPPAGVDFFLTANMSGCKFFIDQIIGSKDLIVYHANTHKHPSAPHSPVNDQSQPASDELDGFHTRARADYTAAPHNLGVVSLKSLAKPTYYGGGALAEERKARQGRNLTVLKPVGSVLDGTSAHVATPVRPEFHGGCSIMGFYSGGTWSFYYQTWGDVSYDRPTEANVIAKKLLTGHWNYLHKSRTEGSKHRANEIEVVDHARFF